MTEDQARNTEEGEDHDNHDNHDNLHDDHDNDHDDHDDHDDEPKSEFSGEAQKILNNGAAQLYGLPEGPQRQALKFSITDQAYEVEKKVNPNVKKGKLRSRLNLDAINYARGKVAAEAARLAVSGMTQPQPQAAPEKPLEGAGITTFNQQMAERVNKLATDISETN